MCFTEIETKVGLVLVGSELVVVIVILIIPAVCDVAFSVKLTPQQVLSFSGSNCFTYSLIDGLSTRFGLYQQGSLCAYSVSRLILLGQFDSVILFRHNKSLASYRHAVAVFL